MRPHDTWQKIAAQGTSAAYAIARKDGMYSGAYSNDDLKSDFEAAINGKCEHSADETMMEKVACYLQENSQPT